jgi:hypothetical protein
MLICSVMRYVHGPQAFVENRPKDDGNTADGRRFLRRVMNNTNGQLTYPATMAAMHVLQHGDTYLSHKTTVYYHKAFSSRWLAQDESEQHVPYDLVHLTTEQAEAHAREQPRGQPRGQPQEQAEEHAKPWTCVDDYIHRPEELEQFSPTLLNMFYEKKPKDKYLGAEEGTLRNGTLHRLPFPPTHPQADTHMLITRRNPVLLQFIGTPPTQPSESAEEEALQG